jgi:predicted CXXCH cytochrome family protein
MKKMQLIAMALAAAAFAFTSVANAGIKNTRHNLSTSGGWNYTTAGAKYTGGVDNGDTAEICVFCHTPHGGTSVGVGPLWNRDFNPGGTGAYTTYDSWTIDGTAGSVAGAGNYAGSMLCLSCHDGTQAMDSLINAPTSAGANGYAGGSASDQGWAWTESKWMSSGIIQFELAFVGTDLTDDHPVMIQYGGGGLSSGGGTLGDPDFNLPLNVVKNGITYWYFDTDTSGSFSGHDIKMYTYDLGGGVGDEPFVECYTCHDPHVETNRPFLRMSNSDSDLCLTCHNK